MQLKLSLTGADELEEALRGLPRDVARRALRAVLLKAAEPMVAEAKARLPSNAPWAQREYIAAGYRLTPRQQAQAPKPKRIAGQPIEVFVYVGVKPKRHLHLLEFGTGPRYTKSGAYRGRMAPNPYMRPAFDQTAEVVLDNIGKFLWPWIEAYCERARRRAARKG